MDDTPVDNRVFWKGEDILFFAKMAKQEGVAFTLTTTETIGAISVSHSVEVVSAHV